MMGEKKQQQGLCKIHNVRFYNLSPRAINNIAYNQAMSLLALTRDDASIEIWNIQYAPYMQQTIVGSTTASIEAIGWCGNRLFTTGLTGELIEWDLQMQRAKQKLLLTGNAAWCLDVSKQQTHLVVGTDSGFLNVFDVSTADEINYVKVFDKQDGKILCCKFDHSGEFVVTGSAETIRVWELKTGHAIYKMSTGRTKAKNETVVWSLAVLKDLTIVAGDSRGYITIWNGKLGAQIDSIQGVKTGDVLTVAVNEDESMFACAGINPKIRVFALSEVKKGDVAVKKWVKFLQRAVHEHDVKTLQFVGSRIFSGGIDGYLGLSDSSKSKSALSLHRFGPFLDNPCTTLATEKRILLLKYVNYVELWQLGLATETVQLAEDEREKRKYLTLKENLHKLLELRAKNDASIVCTTISPDGEYLIYSTEETVRLFQLTYESNKITGLCKIKDVPEQFTACTKCLFASDSQKLYLVKRNQTIDVFKITSTEDTIEVHYEDTIKVNKSLKGHIAHIVVSDCGKYLVCADVCCNITVWRRNKRSWSHHINLPKYPLSPTAIAIHKNTPKLVAAFADSKIFEYHLEEMKFLCSTTNMLIPNQDTFAIKNIVLDPRNENVFILHNDTNLFVLQKKKVKLNTKSIEAKKAKVKVTQDDMDENITNLILKKSIPNEHLISLSWLDDSELIAVGVNPVTMVEQLPASLKEKRFGVS